MDGMTSAGRSWLSGKLKILDPHRHVWKRGKSGPIPFIIAASGESIIQDNWFAKIRYENFLELLSTDGGTTPRTFVYPTENPQFAFILRMHSISGDGAYLRKELALSAGHGYFNKCCLFCDALYGI
jgi:hypothetical protein